MKKQHLLFCLLCICATFVLTSHALVAQNLSYGFTAGGNIAVLRGPFGEGDSGSPHIGARFGVFVNYELNTKLSLHTKLLYSSVGVNYKRYTVGDTLYVINEDLDIKAPFRYSANAKGDYNLAYFNIPLQFMWRVSSKIGIGFGTQIGYLLRGSNKGEALLHIGRDAGNQDQFETEEEYLAKLYRDPYIESFDESESLNTIDFSLVGGVYWHFSEKINLSVSANYGLTSVQQVTHTIPDPYYNLYVSTMVAWKLN